MPVEDNVVAAEILATCNALGSEIRGVYTKSSDCLNCLKDLILYLRRDDEEHTILRQLGELRLVQTDLLPIIKQYSRCKDIFLMALRLLVILTNPAFLLYKEEVPEEKNALNIYLNIIGYLQNYKQAFTDAKVWSILCDQLKQLLSVDSKDRDEDERLTIERILIIIRNVLHVPASDADQKRTDDDATLHDQVLWALHLSNMEDLIIYLSQNEKEHFYCLHVLEIISLMLREQTPEVLVAAGQRRTTTEKEEDARKLAMIRQKESENRAKTTKQWNSQRFNGTYYVKNMKSISDREHIAHKLLTTHNAVKFDADKSSRRIPKNRLPICETSVPRRSTLTICLFLKQFCSDIISNSYNVFMASVKRELTNKRTDDHDDSYYLWAIYYFLGFNRRHNFQLEAVSETVSIHTFHYVQSQIDSYYEMLLIDKKKAKNWSRRIHLGLKAYRELLETLKVMDTSSESTVKTCSDVIKSNIFYVVEYRELLLTLLMNYDEVKFPLSYLVDLVETTHLFLKMLENYAKGHSGLIVQGKKRKRAKKKKKPRKKVSKSDADMRSDVEDFWFTISGDLSAILQGRKPVPSDIVPFDATSTLSFEEQKVEIVYKIRGALSANEPGHSVALLRAARDLWPENNVFGAADIEPEDEFDVLREIFLADLQRERPPLQNDAIEEENSVEEDQGEEDEMADEYITPEQKLSTDDFLSKFASPKVVYPCCRLLSNYKNNSISTNSALLKLMHRIAWDCKMHALFFQASVFLVFQKILHDPDMKFEPIIGELSRFCKFILGKFFQVSNTNKKVFIEILFWKGMREAYELEEGYGSHTTASLKTRKKKKKGNQVEEEPSETSALMEDHLNVDPILEQSQNVPHSIERSPIRDNLEFNSDLLASPDSPELSIDPSE